MFMRRRLYCKLHGLVSCLIKEQLQAMEVFQQADASRQKSSSAGPKLTFQFLCDDSSTLPLDALTERCPGKTTSQSCISSLLSHGSRPTQGGF